MRSQAPYRNISLLWAEPDFAPSLATLHAGAFSDPWDARAICNLLEADTAIAFVATVNQAADIVGFIIGRQLIDEAEIITLGVAATARRRGVGRRLLKGLEAAASSAGAQRVVLEVSDRNAPALQLYKNAGYTEVGRRREYYRGASGLEEDALVLSRSLAA